MDYIKQLDEVLLFLSSDKGNSSLETIKKTLNKKVKIRYDGDDLIRVLNRLKQDGNLHFEDFEYQTSVYSEKRTERRYSISFDGKVFILQKGGYAQLEKNKIINRNKNRKNSLNQKILVWSAVGAAIGTIALVGWEIYKYYFLHVHQ